MGNAKKEQCLYCEEWFDIDENEDKYDIKWWTKKYCSPNCAVLSGNAALTKHNGTGMVRFSVSIPIHIHENLLEDMQVTNRSANGMVNYILKNYYVAKEVAKLNK